MSIYELRRDYTGEPLDASGVAPDPYEQFERWYRQAVRARVTDPNAMTLATATADGRPSARIVLLKGTGDPRGFIFYTDYGSRKARELDENPHAALVFYWAELSRQVRVTGRVEKLSHEDSKVYFRSRPKDAQLAARASAQSRALPDRAALEERVAEERAAHEDEEVRMPHDWGGYRLVPESFEFWQGRPGRLHDRIQYGLEPDGGWRIERLAP